MWLDARVSQPEAFPDGHPCDPSIDCTPACLAQPQGVPVVCSFTDTVRMPKHGMPVTLYTHIHLPGFTQHVENDTTEADGVSLLCSCW